MVFEIPVPILALEAVCESISDYKKQLNRAIELGLIEVSSEAKESNRCYRVSRVIPNIRIPEAPEVYSLYRKAHEVLTGKWGNQENESKEKWQEIFRLLFADIENLARFRQGFSQMLAVQYNAEADGAYEAELRKVADDLVEDGLCTQLENYLKQEHWKKADDETAWIFYQVMVKENYKDWQELLEKFPCETLKEINQHWLENSNEKFGISIQSEIYGSLEGMTKLDVDAETLKLGISPILEFDQIINLSNISVWWRYSLPILIYTRERFLGNGGFLIDSPLITNGGIKLWISYLVLRLANCNL